MTEDTNNPAEPVQPSDPAKPTPGEYLRNLREEKGHTHAVVGEALHLTAHYIKALEGDEYGKLPGLTFVKGYLRSYARFLAADEEKVLVYFDEHISGLLDAGKNTERVQRSRRRQDQALRWAIGAGLVVVAGLVAGWWFMSGNDTRASVTESRPVATPQTTAGRPQTQTANTPVAAQNSTPLTGTYTPAPAPNTANPVASQTLRTAPGETVTLVNVPAPDSAATLESTNDAITITPQANGARQVSLVGAGEDELRVTFNGNSWIEVDDGRRIRLYNNMLSRGDTLTIRGEAPFHVLLGDATQVEISVNDAVIDISGEIRDDSTARLELGAAAGEEAPL